MTRPLSPEKKFLSVGDVSQRMGIAISALHFYEREGLITAHRSAGNQRRYPRDILRRVAVIKTAQRVGIPLAEIRDTLAQLPDGRAPNAEDWAHLSMRWRMQLNERISHLEQLRDQLDGCIGCGCLSLAQCPLRNPGDILGQEMVGAVRFQSESEIDQGQDQWAGPEAPAHDQSE
ncbi:MerR family transcriptional regulator, redox-sensitive transcriptional activator SoxR [Kushneria avicenniae]|uniref:Redox-sensitive transcriptional activator SoxR n=1 Tax=Kushneria avicenniae TaxID=402385 RepID=A0A1I1GA80_9GAMM|nr:redox-sensitive transcriptional activator SoxR [Kushneria avicenniae]SFC06748.1 MerR family transcriptional regulator, redox-sensitive transcriptional activator SoxR [Kushneria avicenniae]